MQVEPIKPTLKAPGINLLKLKYNKRLSTFAFKCNLRRYTVVGTALIPNILDYRDGCLHTVQLPLINKNAGSGGEPLLVGVLHVRVRVTPINPNVVAVRPPTHCPPRHRMPFELSVGRTRYADLLGIEGLFTQGL